MKFVFEWGIPPVNIPERRGRMTIHAKDAREARQKLIDRLDSEVFSYKQIEPEPEPKKEV